MKAPSDLLSYWLSAAEHQKKSTAIKRVAGGLRTEIAAAELYGLSDSDLKTLQKAESILGHLATLRGQAAKLKKAQEDQLRKTTAAVQKEMSANFGKLLSVAGQVALVGAVNSSVLREGRVRLPSDLDYYYNDALSSLEYRLAKDAIANKKLPAAVVAESWQKFVEGKADLLVRHQGTINALCKHLGIKNDQSA